MAKKQKNLAPPRLSALAGICNDNDMLRNFCKPGLGAIKGSERKNIIVPNPSGIGCSVQLDEAAEAEFPEANRWDYAMEYGGYLFFIEVHPASTSEIGCMIKKVDFIKSWLRTNAPEILELPKPNVGQHRFYWMSSGGTDLKITAGSRQAKLLALRGIVPVGAKWDYNRIIKLRN